MSVTTSSETAPTQPTQSTPPSQSEVLEAILGHHAALQQAVADRAAAVVDAAERLADVTPHRDAFVELLREEVLPHAVAEEQTLYRVGATLAPSRLLVGSMVMEHRRLMALVDNLEAARTPVAMAANALAVRVLFEAHLAKENDQLLPTLVLERVDLAGLLEGMHEILGEAAGHQQEQGGCGCGGCGCGADDEATGEAHHGDLDVRSLPHAARHERIFGVVSQLVPGEAFVLANDHDPKPLRYQLEAQNPGKITWDYLEQGPELWRVQIGRI
jgi:uncharacterized protein (DUF2249 family)